MRRCHVGVRHWHVSDAKHILFEVSVLHKFVLLLTMIRVTMLWSQNEEKLLYHTLECKVYRSLICIGDAMSNVQSSTKSPLPLPYPIACNSYVTKKIIDSLKKHWHKEFNWLWIKVLKVNQAKFRCKTIRSVLNRGKNDIYHKGPGFVTVETWYKHRPWSTDTNTNNNLRWK